LKNSALILVFLTAFSLGLQSQGFLRISVSRLGSVRSYEVPTGEMLSYKLKGDLVYRKDRVIGMQDSSIMFENFKEIKLSQIKALRLNKNVHLASTFQTVFLWGAIGFVSLNTLNNAITETSPVFNEKAVYISAGLLAASLITRELNLIRVRAKHADLKILIIDYEHLNSGQ